jgi:hypothetical protein
MGNSESGPLNSENKEYFNEKYNWIPSFPLKEYEIITDQTINNYIKTPYNKEKSYIDLRNNCPPVINVDQLPLHPIATITSLLNYHLAINKLDVFPPSRLFIYKNCAFYKSIQSLLSYEIIFKSIEKYGFCSENDFPSFKNNIDVEPSLECYKKAEPYKFIEIYRVENSIDILKHLLQNDYVLAIGFVLYYNINNVIDKLWVPDFSMDKRVGGLTGLLVGYIDNIECFILQLSYGKNFGKSGYIMIPYNYIIDKELVPEIYYIDFKKTRIEGFLNQQRELISLESTYTPNNYFN